MLSWLDPMLKRPLPVYDDLSSEEGEVSSSSSSDVESDQEFSLKPALPVGKFDANFRETDEPTSGEQYLCLVRHERKKLPPLEVAKEVKQISALKTLKELLVGFRDSCVVKELDSEWAEHFWNGYRQYEATMLALFESVKEVNVDFPSGPSVGAADWLKFFQENKPSTEICVALQEEQDLVMKLMHYYTNWIQSSTYTELDWLSSVLLCLDRKLSSQQISSLRRLVNALAALENNEKANELILVICKSYGQHDLVSFK